MENDKKSKTPDRIILLITLTSSLGVLVFGILALLYSDSFFQLDILVAALVRLCAFFFVFWLYRRWKNVHILPLAILFLMMGAYRVHSALMEEGLLDRCNICPLTNLINLMIIISCYYVWTVFRNQEKEKKKLEEEKNKLNSESQSLRVRLHQLENILPMCQYCKRVRTGDGDPLQQKSWNTIEDFLSEKHRGTAVSHGICPDCARKYHPELFEDEQE